ncbi:unnamed protein product [Rotaria sordida]|uniref:Uncharacterized protein n=1 Tax=Rotaria sordida TaxID=392033 RepID=A0A815LLR6_9BILA|nr:unnamed protein product [Rotaria sordida]CAF1358595.1 unnamed protein product [Rotaria sordida]CAF1408481.1 unnamed protein product [Rotaria sordida]CAF1409176.1 unnamed protein product [Rotaria sordida]CAF1551615.1 unnamed protein product [Rotaria sordida]
MAASNADILLTVQYIQQIRDIQNQIQGINNAIAVRSVAGLSFTDLQRARRSREGELQQAQQSLLTHLTYIAESTQEN